MTLKRLKLPYLIVLILGLSSIVACKKTATGGYASLGTLTATVGSTNFVSSLTEAVYSPVTYGTFSIVGLQSGKDSTFLQIQLPIYGFTVGTPFSSDTLTSARLSWYDSQSSYEYDAVNTNGASHCLINVTSWDSAHLKVAGTFTGALYNINNLDDSIVISKGTFSTSYTQE